MTGPVNSDVVFRVLLQLILILLVAWGLGLIADRLGFTAVIGELLTGFVLGPSILGAITPSYYQILFPQNGSELLDILALLGLILLLAMVGIEVDIDLIQERLKSVAAIGVLGMVVPFLFGAAFGFILPAELLSAPESRHVFSLFLATALSISAIPVIARVLRDLAVLDQPIGQITIAAAMLTDVIGWIVLSIVTGVARGGSVDAISVVTVIITLIGFLLLAFTIGQRILNFLLPWISKRLKPRSQLSFLLIVILVASSVTWRLGLEPAVGAFVAGILAARSNAIVDSVADSFESMTLGIFAPIFFAVAGIRADLSLLFTPRVMAVGIALIGIATVGKFVGVYTGAVLTGSSRWEALTMGIGLNARGAIEFVIATLGLEFGILTVEMYTVILGVAVVTTLVTPPLLRWTLRLDPTENHSMV